MTIFDVRHKIVGQCCQTEARKLDPMSLIVKWFLKDGRDGDADNGERQNNKQSVRSL